MERLTANLKMSIKNDVLITKYGMLLSNKKTAHPAYAGCAVLKNSI